MYILNLLADTIWLYSDKNPHKDNVVYILKDLFEINYDKLAFDQIHRPLYSQY